MSTTVQQKAIQFRPDLILPVVTALAITLWCFYIDEGRYSFAGILKPGNVFFLIVYVGLFLGFQLLVKIALEYFLGKTQTNRVISGALAALSLPLALAVFLSLMS